MIRFAQKYPGMFTIYAKGKEHRDERKLYRYRIIKIFPSKVLVSPSILSTSWRDAAAPGGWVLAMPASAPLG